MKKIIISLFVLGICSLTMAQNLEWGEVQSGKYWPAILGNIDQDVYTADYSSNNTFTFQTIDLSNEMKPIFTQTFEMMKESGALVRYEGMAYVGDNYLFFVSHYVKKTKMFKMNVSAYNGKTGSMVAGTKQLFETEVEGRWKRGSFDILVPKDHSKILVVHDVYSVRKKKRSRNYVLLDEEFEEVMSKEMDGDDYIPSSYIMDNDGSIYYVGYNSTTGVFIGSFDALKEYDHWREDLDLENANPDMGYGNLNIGLNTKNELIVAGYYTRPVQVKEGKKRTRRELAGAYYARFNAESKEQIVGKTSAFQDDFLNQFKSERDLKKGKSANLSNKYNTNFDMHEMEDGSVVMAGEAYAYYIRTDGNGNTAGETFVYGDIVTAEFDKEGNLKWAHRVPKLQRFSWNSFGGIFIFSSRGIHILFVDIDKSTRHFSFVSGIMDNKMVMLYYDNPKNPTTFDKDNFKTQAMNNVKSGVLRKCTIDLDTGEKIIEDMETGKSESTYMVPRTSRQETENDPIIFYSRKGSKYRWGKLSSGK